MTYLPLVVRQRIWKSPVMLTAPGPPRSAVALTVPFPVAGMQNTAARVLRWTARSSRLPAGWPVSTMRRAAGLPNAPAERWLGQKRPAASLMLDVAVLSGDSATDNGPMNWPASGGQSKDVAFEPTGAHGWF